MLSSFSVGLALHVCLSAGAYAGVGFPDFNGKDVYIVTPENASGLVIDTLYIPKGKTIKAGPGVTAINWSVTTIKIEEGATFDLSAPQDVLPKAADAVGQPPQHGYCTNGEEGYPGSPGQKGRSGVDLQINEIVTIDNQGSIWIHTDGGPGGDGGRGGKGGTGGGHYSKWPDRSCGAGPGGPGGRGGAAGDGGLTARVLFLKAKDKTPYGFPNGEAPICGNSARPSSATGKSGVIVIYGGRGCSGQHGLPGGAGDRGLVPSDPGYVPAI